MARSSGCNRNVIGWSFLKQARFLSVRVSSFGKSETSDTWAKVPIPAQFRPIYINLLQSNKTEISIFLAWNRLPVPVDPLSDSAPPTCSGASPSETKALRKLYSSIPGSIPSQKFTMFVFLVTRCIKLSAEGANNIYRDAESEWDTEMQSSFNNIGSLALTPKIRSGSPSLLEIDSSWWESWHDLTLQWAQYCNNSNHDDDDMVAANCCYLPSAWFHTSVNLWMEQLPLRNSGLHLNVTARVSLIHVKTCV